MTGSRDKFHDDGDLDELAHELDLDMDTPIGASFAAALREPQSGDIGISAEDIDFALGDENGDEADADPWKAEPAPAATPRSPDAYLTVPEELPEELATLDDEDGYEEDDAFASLLPDVEVDEPAAKTHTVWPPAGSEPSAGAASMAAADDLHPGEEDEPWSLQPSASTSEDHADDPANDEFAEALVGAPDGDPPPPPVAGMSDAQDESDAAGQGLGFDYAFASAPENGDRVIPRISVHAFCTRTAVLGLMRTIQRDRRMRNVSMEVFEGGARAATDHYVNETTPNLLILEAAGDPRQLLADLDTLAEYCDENIRVMVIGDTNDIRLYRELMRRGVSEYLVMPVDPVQVIRAISGLFTDPDAPFMGKSLAVTGVKGGVGASSLAHNLAWSLSERVKVNSTLVDLDLNFGTTGLDFNQDTGATIADALMSPDRFDDAIMGRLLTRATDRLSLFTAPATLDRTYNLDPDTYVRVLEQVRSSVPFVILDMPHIWSEWFKSTIVGADEIVVVAAPDLASLRNGKNLIDFLRAARPNDAPPRLVLNMVGLPKRPEIPPKDFGQAIGLDPSLVLPFDAQLFGTAANNGQMIFDVAPDSKIAQGVDQLATLLTGRELQAERPSMLKKLLGR